jgi:hypothetical protein
MEPDIKMRNVKNFYYEAEGVIKVLDDLEKARDELFEIRLTEGIDQHKKLLKSSLPHQS